MKTQYRTTILITGVAMFVAAAFSHYVTRWGMGDASSVGGAEGGKSPLYWVAPMDPNYRRDKPGKSPMGMDLIPVYADTESGKDTGTVRISPDVLHNLGVRTAPVTRGRLDIAVNTVGYVQYDEDHLIHIHPRVEGWIEKLHIKAAGDTVEQGAPLYDLYAPMLVNAQEEFLLALKRNNVTLIEAARARLASLQVPASEIRRLEASRRVSQTISVTAPQSGVLDNLMVREGMFVGPGMEIMAIGQLEHIWVIGELFERQSALVQVGDQVQMHLDYLPGRSWQGQVDYIYPSLDPKTRTARVRVKFDNTDGQLRPGMFTRMRITSSPGEESLLVPLEALVRTGEQNRVVLAMGEGRFKSVAVRVGHVSDDQAQITDGLEADDQIVTSALFLIDSESSKTSDFRRMYHGAENQGGDQAKAEKPVSVWVSATVKGVMPGHRTLTLRHDPIPSWKWPAMTMDFTVADDVDIEGLATGMTLHIQVTRKGKKRYVITQIHRPEGHKP